MSSVSVSSTPLPSSSSSGQDSGGSNVPSPSSGLYLYTFLATLLLLLGISAAIVARSVLLRRRTRRMFEESIANGTWIPPAPKIPVNLGNKPLLHDAYTNIDPNHEDVSLKTAGLWDTVKPVSVTLAKADNVPMVDQFSIQQPSSEPQHRQFPLARLLRMRAPTPTLTPSVSESQIVSPSHTTQYKTVTVSVMIAMPHLPQQKAHHHDGADRECPAVEFGISDVELPRGWSLEPRASSD
jgi:hypothetical protein